MLTIVLANLLSESYHLLEPDYKSTMVLLLTELVAISRALANNHGNLHDIPRTDISATFTPTMAHQLANGLWFASFAFSISIALFGMLAKQWVNENMSLPSGSPRDRARIRHYRYMQMEEWGVPRIITSLTKGMHACVGMFVLGLGIFMHSFDERLGLLFAILAGMSFTGYAVGVLISVMVSRRRPGRSDVESPFEDNAPPPYMVHDEKNKTDK